MHVERLRERCDHDRRGRGDHRRRLLRDHIGVGANSVVMPGNDIPEGVAIGASSSLPVGFEFEPWTVYAGVPIARIANRNRDGVLRQVEEFIARRSA